MNTTNQRTLDIQGTIDSYLSSASLKFCVAVLLGWLGYAFWPEGKNVFDVNAVEFDQLGVGVSLTCFLCSFLAVATLLFAKETYVYLDITGRQLVSIDHRAWWETSQRARPLTEFSGIVIRHLCHDGGEGEDTYTGSVGLRPVTGKSVLWVKNFPTTEDEVPRAAHEFAAKLQEMTGLPILGATEITPGVPPDLGK